MKKILIAMSLCALLSPLQAKNSFVQSHEASSRLAKPVNCAEKFRKSDYAHDYCTRAAYAGIIAATSDYAKGKFEEALVKLEEAPAGREGGFTGVEIAQGIRDEMNQIMKENPNGVPGSYLKNYYQTKGVTTNNAQALAARRDAARRFGNGLRRGPNYPMIDENKFYGKIRK